MRLTLLHIVILCGFILLAPSISAQDLQDAQQVDSLLLIESTKLVYKNPDKSIEIGVSVFENTNLTKTTRTRALMLISLAHTSKRDYQKALEYVIRANEFSSNLDDVKLQVEILFRIGILYQQLKIYDKSIEYLEKTEQAVLTHSSPGELRKYLANSYIVKGFIYKDNLNCDIALEYFDKGIREYEKLNDESHSANLSIVYYNKGNCYNQLSEYEKAKKSFDVSIAFGKIENANSLISFAQKGLAEVYLIEGKYEQAITLLKDALERSKEVGDLVLNLGIYKGLFENHLALNQQEEYQKFYDLYLTTQLDIKVSERNSINDSIVEDSKNKEEELNGIKAQFNRRLKQIVIVIFVFIVSVFLIQRKNKKTINLLQKRVESLQNPKTIS